ncbi:MAG: efflux RND transporter periplasmic adaptor subunit [Proteobacteria bacterium]|nr:efflux RND transporter periplasmic adaptor subunit [Pseudomonadota bacterium]
MKPCMIFMLLALSVNLPAFAEAPPRSVIAPPALLKQLKIVAIGQAELRDSLRVPARVDLDQHRLARIGATVTGRIVETQAWLGQTVRKGETLAILNSTELGMAQAAYLKAASQVSLRELAVSRARRLLEADVIASAELLEREGMLREAEVDLRAATDQLRVMGMNEADLVKLAREKTIHSFTPIVASLSGVVIERNVTVGQVVQPADALFTVADLSHVWLVAELPEQQAHWAREGDEAYADIAALEDENLSGKLIYVADLVNPETRTVTVRMDMPNPRRILKPQMLATLLIRKQGTNYLVLPDSAVIRDDNRDHVFVQIAPTKFDLRPVQLGEDEAGIRPVISGLKAGEKVVTDGGFHLNNERLRKELE